MMQRFLAHPTARQFGRFVIIGFLNTGIDWAVFFGLTSWVGWFVMHILVANTISFLAGFTSSYVFNRRWTFKSTDPRVTRQVSAFLMVNLIGLGMNLALVGVTYHLTHSRLIAKTVAVAVVLFWNFTAGKLFAFRQ